MFFKKFFKVSLYFLVGLILINILYLLIQEVYYLPFTIEIIKLKKWKNKYETFIKEEQKRVNAAVLELENLNKKIKNYSKRISLGEYHLINKYNSMVNEYYYLAKNYETLFDNHKKNLMLFEQNSKKLQRLINDYSKRRFLLFIPFKLKYEFKKGEVSYTITKSNNYENKR
ncbi:MAG: hypothetical protein N2505_04500 [Endomicrobia bacterium]|nr:hypothetical protein [Endomicrobiia bacterium]